MNKANKYLGIINFILWTGLFLSVIFLNYNANGLKSIAIGATFIVLVDIFFDMLENRDKRIKRKIVLEYVVHELEFDNDKQGDE